MPKLKLFCAVSGFHDSYVAAPSRAAALRAWGARTDLFAMGAAEQVDDPGLLAKARSKPGTVFKTKRGKSGALEEARAARPAPKRKPPSRVALNKAERAADQLEAMHQAERTALDKEIARLEERRRKLLARHETAHAKKVEARNRAAAAYEAASAD